MKRVLSIEKLFVRLEQVLLTVILGSLLVLAFAQVVLREIFSSGLLWADVVNRHLVLWIAFLGGAVATREERHLHIDVIRRYLSPGISKYVSLVTDLFATGVCGFLVNSSLTFVLEERSAQTMVIEGLPAWYAEMIIPIGFLILTAHFLVRLSVPAFHAGETRRDV